MRLSDAAPEDERAREVYLFMKWFTVGICSISYLFGYFHRFSTAVLADDMARDWNVPKASLGIFSSIFFWPYGIMQPVMGMLADVVEAGYIVAAANVLAGAGALMIAFAKSVGLAYGGRFVLGFACSAFFVPANKVAANWFSEKEFRFFSGALIGIGGIGSILSQTPLSLLGHAIGWRMCIMGVGCLSVVFGVLALVFVRSHPQAFGYKGRTPYRVARSWRDMLQQLVSNMRSVVTMGDFWVLEFYMFFGAGLFMNISSFWAVPFVHDVFHMTERDASLVAMSLSIGTIVGSPLLPVIAHKVGTRKWTMVGFCGMGFVCCLILAIWGNKMTGYAMCLPYFLICLGVSSPQCIALPLFKEYCDSEMTATMVGAGNAGSFIGGAIQQMVSSAIVGTYGFHKFYPFAAYQIGVWVLCTITAFLGVFSLVLVREPKPESDTSTDQPF